MISDYSQTDPGFTMIVWTDEVTFKTTELCKKTEVVYWGDKKTQKNRRGAQCFNSSVWVSICAEEVSGPIFTQSTATAVTWNCHHVC